MYANDYQARGIKCTSWTEYKSEKTKAMGTPSAHYHSQYSRCTREHRIYKEIHLPGKCNI